MPYDFDRIIDRRHSDSEKWRAFGPDVLPLWVADMDFTAPEPVIRALHDRVEHGIFGYGGEPPELREVLVARLQKRYAWSVPAEAIVFVPGLVVGLNVATRAAAQPGDGVLVQTPIYRPIIDAPGSAGQTLHSMALTREANGRYTLEPEQMAAAVTDRTRTFTLCNPHNPVGRVFTGEELTTMAELCLRHDLTIISDEIHCDLVFGGAQHIPIAALSPELAARTITLMAPSKTFNIAGLYCSAAIIPDPELRRRFKTVAHGIVPSVNLMAFAAALAAYRDGGPWLSECLRYLEGNRDYLMQFVDEHLPGISMSPVEGTYLAWLDCREAGITGTPAEFFLKQARVGLNDGAWFGQGGEGFVRLNFGCPRATLTEALERMNRALETGGAGD
jgi:cysteine-S-conjugate beta-lyase